MGSRRIPVAFATYCGPFKLILDVDMGVGDPAQAAPSTLHTAWHRIRPEAGYLRSELFDRRTIDETRAFLDAVLAAAIRHRLPHVLICVRNSVPIFTVERYGFSRYLDAAFKSRYKIALVGDALELRIAHQYIATLARMRGVKLRAFADESAAISWLHSADSSGGAAPPAA